MKVIGWLCLMIVGLATIICRAEEKPGLVELSKELTVFLGEGEKLALDPDADLELWDGLELRWLKWEIEAVKRVKSSSLEGFDDLLRLSKLTRSSLGAGFAKLGMDPIDPIEPRMEYESLRTADGRVYKTVVVREVEPDGLRIMHSSGMAKLLFINLPDEVSEEHGYDPEAVVKNQEENQQRISKPDRIPNRAGPQVADADCMQIAKNEWPSDYAMQKHTYERQVAAKRSMERASDLECKRIALEEWPGDYVMQKYTYEKQVEAKAAMGR